ncbi:hypothetical protein [Devosia sp. DBB001]|nr:hypothetical protein [Devosia sp. DBB001]
MLNQRAKDLGIAPDERLRHVAACAIRDDLYGAVTDGQYETDYGSGPAEKKSPQGIGA